MKKLSKIIKVSTSVLLGCGLIGTLPLAVTSCGKNSVSISYDGEYNFQGEVNASGHSKGTVKMTDGATLKVETINEEESASIDLSGKIYLDESGHVCWHDLGGKDTPYQFKLFAVKGKSSTSLSRKFSLKIAFPTHLVFDTTISDVHAVKGALMQTADLSKTIKDNLGYPYYGTFSFSLVDSKLHPATLPSGLTLEDSTGKIKGTPSESLISEGLRVKAVSQTASQNFIGYSNEFDLSVEDRTTSLSIKEESKNIKSVEICAGQSYRSPTEWLEWTNNIIITGDSTKTIDKSQIMFDWSHCRGSVPMGLSLDPKTGEIYGAPVSEDIGKSFFVSIGFASNGKVGYSNTFEIKITTSDKQLYFQNSYSSIIGFKNDSSPTSFETETPIVIDQFNDPVDSSLLKFTLNTFGSNLPSGVTFSDTTGKITGSTSDEAIVEGIGGISISVTYKTPSEGWTVTDGTSNKFGLLNLVKDDSKYTIAEGNDPENFFTLYKDFATKDLSSISYIDSKGEGHLFYSVLDDYLTFHWNHEFEYSNHGIYFNQLKGIVWGNSNQKQECTGETNCSKIWFDIKSTKGETFKVGSEQAPKDKCDMWWQ